MPKLIGRKRRMSKGELIGTTQLKRKVSRKLGWSPWSGKVSARRRGCLAVFCVPLVVCAVVLRLHRSR